MSLTEKIKACYKKFDERAVEYYSTMKFDATRPLFVYAFYSGMTDATFGLGHVNSLMTSATLAAVLYDESKARGRKMNFFLPYITYSVGCAIGAPERHPNDLVHYGAPFLGLVLGIAAVPKLRRYLSL